jgi:hypothetical protein
MSATTPNPGDPVSPEVAWRKSSHSATGGDGDQCVEIGRFLDGSGRVAVRHSQDPGGTVLVYTQAEWAAFVAGAKEGEFDDLTG